MPSQPIEQVCSFSRRHHGFIFGAKPKVKVRPMNRMCHLVSAVAVPMLAVLTSTPCLGEEMTPLHPAHARLLDGRKLLIDRGGVLHVQIAPAPVVRLTNELLSLTFAFPASEEEALEIAKFPHTGAIVQSEKVLKDIVSLLENSGLTKKAAGQNADIDSFVFTKDFRGMEFGEMVAKREDGGFKVEFVALVSRPEDRGGELRARRYSYNFDKGGLIQCYSEYDLLVGPALVWQTMVGSPPPRVSETTRRDLARKIFAMCGKVLPPGRKDMGSAE